MSAVLELPAKQTVSPPVKAEYRFVLYDADWDTYEKILDAFWERPIRVTYDRGALEIPAGTYEPTEQSLNFPFLPVAEFAQFLHWSPEVDETTQLKSFVKWVGTRVLPAVKSTGNGADQGA